MRFPDGFLEKMQPRVEQAFAAIRVLEAGGIAYPGEGRMIGHYRLRNPALAPNDELRADIVETNARITQFAAAIHGGPVANERGERFTHVLLIGIGGCALGPQLIAEALGATRDPIDIFFLDNTDPEGFDRVLEKIGAGLAQNARGRDLEIRRHEETRNGMLEAAAAFAKAGLQFPQHAAAVTGRPARTRKMFTASCATSRGQRFVDSGPGRGARQ